MPATGSPPGDALLDVQDFAARLDGEVVLAISGELDLVTRPRLSRSLHDALRLGAARVVADLAQVTFMGACAVTELLRARNACRGVGGDLVVRSPSLPVLRVLEIVGLVDLVERRPEGGAAPGVVPTMRGVGDDWAAACLTHRYGSTPLVFDRSLVTTAIAPLLDDRASGNGSHAIPPLSGAVSMAPGPSPVVAVLQLWALNDVLHARMDSNCDDARGCGRPDPRRVGIEAALAGAAAAVLTDLEHMSLVDPLTGLLNRRALDRDLRQALAVARRHNQPLTVVMADVEGLKAVNDRSGHAAGDAVIRGVARSLTAVVRTGDNAYRIGGDEFVLLLPDLSREDVEGIMRRTQATASAPFTWGFAVSTEADAEAADEERAAQLLEIADLRMLERRARSRRDTRRTEVDAPAPAAAQRADGPGGITSDHLAAAYRERMVVDWATGMVAESFEVSVDDATAILRQVALARGRTVLEVAQSLMGRGRDGTLLVPGSPDQRIDLRSDAEPLVDEIASSPTEI